ncbi:hypothetical protein O181_073812 [Austropuccinia psidii MF-1]|uniref:Uncharacterized protein n=1 Tax=Austropuccinia psidii MF-1 TaxID=1389203 RepID=A0A9Q3F9U1_9BASI|nr:hypothetical protein [Austropuccinia psidii MF-1]
MSNSNREKSHSESSKRHIYEPVQAVLHGLQGQRLGNVATKPPRSDELLVHTEKVPQRGEKSEILQWIEATIIQTSNQKDKVLEQKKEAAKQGRISSSFSQKATSQSNSPRTEEDQGKELEETLFSKLQNLRIQKAAIENVLNKARN